MLRRVQSSCSRTPTVSWPLHLKLLVSAALLCGTVSTCVSLSFWLETTETTLSCPPYNQLHLVLHPPQKFVGWVAGVFLRILAHSSGGEGGTVSSSELRPAPHPSQSPARKKAVILDHGSLIVWAGAQHHLGVTHSLHGEQQNTYTAECRLLKGTTGAESLCSSCPKNQCWTETEEASAFLLIHLPTQ